MTTMTTPPTNAMFRASSFMQGNNAAYLAQMQARYARWNLLSRHCPGCP